MARRTTLQFPPQFGGVSQQDPALRLRNQCESLTNITPDVVTGLKRRLPSEFIKLVFGPSGDSYRMARPTDYVEPIEFSATEQFILVVRSYSTEPIQIYTKDGVKCTVNFATGQEAAIEAYAYTAGQSPRDYIRHRVINDSIVVLNNTKVATEVDLSPTQYTVPACLIRVVYGAGSQVYDGTFRVFQAAGTVINVSYVYTSGAGVTDRGTIAAGIGVAIGNALVAGGWTNDLGYYVDKDYIIVYGKAAPPLLPFPNYGISFQPTNVAAAAVSNLFESWDSTRYDNDSYYLPSKEMYVPRADSTVSLPVNPLASIPAVFMVKQPSDEFGALYTFNTQTNTWAEALSPFAQMSITGGTMPFKILKTGATTFECSLIPWETRSVGDLDTAPSPSFFTREIQDIFLFKDRLCLVADEFVSMSRTGDYFNFYPTTVTEVLDDDPIDVGVQTTANFKIKQAETFESGILLIGDTQQFYVYGQNSVLSSKTIVIDPASAFRMNLSAKPRVIGDELFFLETEGAYAKLRNYYVSDDSVTNTSSDLSVVTPRYINGASTDILLARNGDLTLVYKRGQGEISVCTQKWENEERIQLAWATWELPMDIVKVLLFGDNQVYVLGDVVDLATGNYRNLLVRMVLDESYKPTNAPYSFHCDALGKVSTLVGTRTLNGDDTDLMFAGSEYLTYMNLQGLADRLRVIEAATAREYEVTVLSDRLKVHDVDLTGTPEVYLGIDMSSSMVLTEVHAKDQEGKNKLMNTDIRMKYLMLEFLDTGHFVVSSLSRNRTVPMISEYFSFSTNPISVTSHYNLGSSSGDERGFRARLQTNARGTRINIETNEIYPMTLLGYSVEAEVS